MDADWLWATGIVLTLGFGYGAIRKGRQRHHRILAHGILIGLFLCILVQFVALAFGIQTLALGIVGGFALFGFVILGTLVFVSGVWLGDMATGHWRTPASESGAGRPPSHAPRRP